MSERELPLTVKVLTTAGSAAQRQKPDCRGRFAGDIFLLYLGHHVKDTIIF